MTKQGRLLYGGLRALDRALAGSEWQAAKYVVLVDENTFRHCLPLLIGSVEALQHAEFVEVPAGEECKCIEVATQVWQTLLDTGSDRSTVLVNLGGGAVCDLGGYVAAGYKRGIRHIHVPTTLLSMVDAAIGGKTAIDLGGVKNSIGHFYPALLTAIEPAFLDTLPPTELANGRIEMVKTAAVTDPDLYHQLTTLGTPVAKPHITAVARLKNRIVRTDPYDLGIRKILNFGHTFGHAIEVCRGLPHGIAVGIGMQAAMYLSVRKLSLDQEVYTSYSRWLKAQLSALNLQLPPFRLNDIEALLPSMHQDKKSADGALRCILMRALGEAVIDVEVSDNEVRDTLLTISK